MIVRIRLSQGPRLGNRAGKNRAVAQALAAVMTPAALMAYVLAFWRLGADLRIAGQFAIEDGFFSHWQVWLPIAVGLSMSSAALNRYGREGVLRLPFARSRA